MLVNPSKVPMPSEKLFYLLYHSSIIFYHSETIYTNLFEKISLHYCRISSWNPSLFSGLVFLYGFWIFLYFYKK